MQEIAVVYYDDLSFAGNGAKVRASVTVPFSYFGKDYEIDLTDEHYRELDEFMKQYVAAARTPEHKSPPWPKRRGRYVKSLPAGVMSKAEFGRQNGFEFVTAAGFYSYKKDHTEAYDRYLEGLGKSGKLPG